MNKSKLTYEKIKEVVRSKGYRFFTGNMNLNLIGVRSSDQHIDKFDDFFVVAYQRGKENVIVVFDEFTTDPGSYYMQQELLDSDGCAIMVPGQYSGLWTLGLHRGKQKALIQKSQVKVYRDSNKDDVMDADPSTIETGLFGINLHDGYESHLVGRNSAGCQVFRHSSDRAIVRGLAEQSAKAYGNSFTYTLLEESDFLG